MKKVSVLLASLLLSVGYAYPQNIRVMETTKLTDAAKDGKFFFPQMSPDGNKVILTGENYQGLSYLDLSTKKLSRITEESGAGYKCSFSQDGQSVIYRANILGEDGIRVSQKIVEKNILDNTELTIAEGDNLSTPLQVNASNIIYTKEDQVTVKGLANAPAQKQSVTRPAVRIADGGLMLFVNGESTFFAPLGEGHYVWSSISPDGLKVLFTLAGTGTYVCDLSGNVLLQLGKANAPVWSPDGNYIAYMVDKDDGNDYVSSDIYVYSVAASVSQKLTDTNDIIEMYPQWTAQGNIVFHSIAGDTYLMKLKID